MLMAKMTPDTAIARSRSIYGIPAKMVNSRSGCETLRRVLAEEPAQEHEQEHGAQRGDGGQCR
jgi:hypothetical protein